MLTGGLLNIDHVVWLNTTTHILNITSSSIRLTNSTIPATTNVEPVHYAGTFPASGYAVFQGNTFGKATGSNDVIDFTGGNRPGPIVEFLNNAFLGSQDDILDLDGTDAQIEGNVFIGAHLAAPNPDTSSAISGGTDSGQTSEWTIVRNYFYDCDHAVLAKEGAFATLINNTIVDMTVSAINFDEPLRAGVVPGKGAYLDGNIIWNTPLVFENVNSDGTTTDLTVRHSILQTATVYPGIGNSNLDPQLLMTTGVTDPRTQLVLLPGPDPAVGTGPNGLDMGANVPPGASISGEPPSPTWRTSATLTVGGPDIYAYMYSVNGGAFSNEIDVTNPGTANAVVPPIQLTGLADGVHTVRVVAKNSAGVWQDVAAATVSKTWTVKSSLVPTVRINEVLAANVNTLNVNGSHPDLIELYNDGPTSVDLSGMAISDTAGQRKFTFPNGTTIAAGQYLVLYGDDDVSPPGIKVNFSLKTAGEGVFLYDTVANGGALIDGVAFGAQLPDESIARKNDGTWTLGIPTFGSANMFAPLGDPHQVKINEWFTTGSGADFIELYNPSTLPVDLGNSYLTDDPISRPNRQQIPQLYFVAPGGKTVFTADGSPTSGPDHVDFKLAYEQGLIGLFDTALKPIDEIIYRTQQNNQSEGRSPNGGALFQFFATPNPGVDNPTAITTPPPPIRITEVNYHPYDPPVGSPYTADDFEYIELLNNGAAAVNFQNARLTSAVDFTFPNVTINPGQRVLIVKNAAAFVTRYNTAGFTIAGQYTGTLSDSSDDITLLDPSNQIIDQVNYSDTDPWPVRADGAGSTLELISTAGSSNDPANWRASYEYGGTPGVAGAGAVNRVVVNEVLTHADAPQLESIELYNTTTASIDISGWYLSDSSGNYKSFHIPNGTTIGAGQYLVFTDHDFDASPPIGANIPFELSSGGDEVTLVSADASGNLLDFEDQVTFGAAADGESFGRRPNGTGQLYPMKSVTLGAANSGPRIGPIAISEVMYNPVGGDSNLEFVELVNLTTQTIDLSDNIPDVGEVPWKIEGIGFDFPVGTTIGPRGTLVVVHFDPNKPDDGFKVDAFRAAYGIGADVQLVGPYNGLLDNAGEQLRLVRPDTPDPATPTTVPFVLVDEVDYGNAAPWPTSPDSQNGTSLIRNSSAVYGDDPTNWTGALATPGKSDLIAPNLVAKDFNFDGHVAGADVQSMVIALTDLRSFQTAHTLTDADLRFIGDVNGDHQVTNVDLQALLSVLISGGGSGSDSPVVAPIAAASPAGTSEPTAQANATVISEPLRSNPSPTISHQNSVAVVFTFADPTPEFDPTLKRSVLPLTIAPVVESSTKKLSVDLLDHYFFLFTGGERIISRKRSPRLSGDKSAEYDRHELLPAGRNMLRRDF